MPSTKHNSTIDKATGLIFPLFDVALSQDMPNAIHTYIDLPPLTMQGVHLCMKLLMECLAPFCLLKWIQ